MRVRAEKVCAFEANGSKAQTGAFCGARDDTYVVDHIASFVATACIMPRKIMDVCMERSAVGATRRGYHCLMFDGAEH
jgi:hypothetical protein